MEKLIFTKANKKIREDTGITLIALVVTVVILIILATISINIVLKDNGIIKRAEKGKDIWENSVEREKDELDKLMNEYDNILVGWEDDTSNKNVKLIGKVNVIFTYDEKSGWDYKEEKFQNAKIEIKTEYSEWTIHTSINNNEEIDKCYVRLKAYSPQGLNLEFTDVEGSNQWYCTDDGYWYYLEIVHEGGNTNALDIRVNNINDEEYTDGDELNVIIIAEYTPVMYDSEGNTYADWNT